MARKKTDSKTLSVVDLSKVRQQKEEELSKIPDDFLDEVKKNLSKDVDKEIGEILSYEKRIAKNKSDLIKKYKIPVQIINILHFFSSMTDWRDERKAQAMKLNYYADLFLVEISKRTNIPYKYLSYIDESELTSFKDP